MWAAWFPFSLPQRWPFCWWVGAVIDQYTRAVLAQALFRHEPDALEVCAMLDRAVRAAGRAPKYVISDRGVQFAVSI